MDLTVVSTFRCNSRCQMCHVWKYPTAPELEISLETLAKLPGGFDNLNLSGGEPTLRRDLAEMIDILYPKARVMEISSNGLYPERLVPIIKKYPNIKVRFSLEGDESTSNRIRGEKDGHSTKVAGLRKLKEAGGTDLGFAFVIQDENVGQLLNVYEFARSQGFELATTTLHNAWQFYKNDNHFYDRTKVAKPIENLITELLKSRNVKNWFRAYLNLGLIEKVLGHERLIPCTAGSDFAFIDPWSDVWACNVRSDIPLGNLARQSWSEITHSDLASEGLKKVACCSQNCWMVTTARTAMRSRIVPQMPKMRPMTWVLKNKLKVALGKPICFEQYIDYGNVKPTRQVPRTSYLGTKHKGNKLDRNRQTPQERYPQLDYINE